MSGACQHNWHFVQGLTARLRCTRCGIMTWPKDAEQKVQEVLQDVHSCSYYCDRPECIKAQRDELRDRLGSMTDREIMQRALEALEWNLPVIEDYGDHEQLNRQHRAIIALRERLAQPEQEPVCAHGIGKTKCSFCHQPQPEQEPVAHTLNCVCGAVWDVSPDGVEEMVHAPNPPQRKPLTDEEIAKIASTPAAVVGSYVHTFARAIESAHGIKENT